MISPIDRPSPMATGLDTRARDEPTVQTQTKSKSMETQSQGARRAQSVSAQRTRADQKRARPLPPSPLKETQDRLRQKEAQAQGLVVPHKVDLVWLALQLFVGARISFPAVSRVLRLLAEVLGIKKAPCPQTLVNWVTSLSIVRIQAARRLQGVSLSLAPFTNGFIWMIDISIGL